jgi:hypothetical protein
MCPVSVSAAAAGAATGFTSLALQVHQLYYQNYMSGTQQQHLAEFQAPAAPFSAKKNAVLYINSNCWTKNGREKIMKELMLATKSSNSSIKVHSYGACDRNMNQQEMEELKNLEKKSGRSAKKDIARRYKFCVVRSSSSSSIKSNTRRVCLEADESARNDLFTVPSLCQQVVPVPSTCGDLPLLFIVQQPPGNS